MEETLPTIGDEPKLEEEEEEEDPSEARACWMAGPRDWMTSPTTSLSLICGAACTEATVAIKARRSLGEVILSEIEFIRIA